MVTSDFSPEVEIRPFRACAMKNMHITLIYGQIAEIFASFRKSGSRNTMVTSDFRPELEIRPFHACAMHPAIITGTVRSLLTWLWGRYHVPQNAFLVYTLMHVYYTRNCCRLSRPDSSKTSAQYQSCPYLLTYLLTYLRI